MATGEKIITTPDQVTASWLTAVLRKSEALTEGSVSSFELSQGGGNWSQNGIIKPNYSPDAKGSLPRRLFLKVVDTEESTGDEYFGPSEVLYYRRDYVDVEDVPLLRCYDAAYSHDLNRYHLLLEDVSETHIEAAGKEVTREYGSVLAEGLASLHVRWWGRERFTQIGEPMHDADHIRRFIDIAAPGVDHILSRFSDELKPHWPDLMRELFDKHPQALINRTADDNGFTIIHGDAGHNNILVPVNGYRPIYLIDRQPFNWSLTTWLGVYDLAYAIVLDWDPEERRVLEIPVLKHYHAQLAERGIAGYPWQQLLDDYRLCVAMGVYIAVEYCRGGINERSRHIWLPMLRRSLIAVDDLHCRERWKNGS